MNKAQLEKILKKIDYKEINNINTDQDYVQLLELYCNSVQEEIELDNDALHIIYAVNNIKQISNIPLKAIEEITYGFIVTVLKSLVQFDNMNHNQIISLIDNYDQFISLYTTQFEKGKYSSDEELPEINYTEFLPSEHITKDVFRYNVFNIFENTSFILGKIIEGIHNLETDNIFAYYKNLLDMQLVLYNNFLCVS